MSTDTPNAGAGASSAAATPPQPPPPDPRAFFEIEIGKQVRGQVESLEAKIAKLQKKLAGMKAADFVLRYRLTGEGGGTWDLKFAGGDVQPVRGDPSGGASSPAEPLVTMSQSLEDWRATQTGGTGSRFNFLSFGSPSGGAAQAHGKKKDEARGRFPFSKDRIDRLRGVRGSVRFQIENDQAQPVWSITTCIGPEGEPGAEPRTAIAIRESDAQAMAEGKLNPQAAFMAGKIKIRGDMGFVMQLGTMMMM